MPSRLFTRPLILATGRGKARLQCRFETSTFYATQKIRLVLLELVKVFHELLKTVDAVEWRSKPRGTFLHWGSCNMLAFLLLVALTEHRLAFPIFTTLRQLRKISGRGVQDADDKGHCWWT